MRFRNTFMLVGLLVVCTVGLAFFGCSDDDDTPTNGVYQGDTYQIVRAQVNDILQDATAQFEDALHSTGVPVAEQDTSQFGERDSLIGILFGPAPIDSSNVPIDSSHWWAFYFTTLSSDAAITRTDSLRWTTGDTPVSSVLHADGMDFRRHYSTTAADTTSSYENLSLATDLHFAGFDGNTATITGTINFDITSKDVEPSGIIRNIYDVQVEITTLSVAKVGANWNTGCPSTGTATVTVAHSYKEGIGTFLNMTWTFEVTFDGGSITADVSNTQGLSAEYGADICSVQ